MACVVLPFADPKIYLAWVGFSLEAECRVRVDDRLRKEAEAQDFLCGSGAEEARRSLLGVIAVQAGRALSRGEPGVSPVMQREAWRLARALDYVERWGAWLAGANGLHAEVAIPDVSVAVLRRRSLRALRDQLVALPEIASS